MAVRDKITFSCFEKKTNVFEIKSKWGLKYVLFCTACKSCCTGPFWVFAEMSLPFMGGNLVRCTVIQPCRLFNHAYCIDTEA